MSTSRSPKFGLSSFITDILDNTELSRRRDTFTRKAPVDRSSSRDTAVACYCCCDEADAAATELMLRATRVPPRGAATSLLEVLPAARQHLEEGRDDETTI